MSQLKFKYLSQENLLKCNLSYAEIVQIIEKTMKMYGEGHGLNPPKPSIYPSPHGFINAMPASLPSAQVAGIKWISVFSKNFEKNLPSCLGLFILNNAETGQPIAVMDASYITAIRTAAVSAVTCKHLFNHPVTSIGIIGSGVQAYYHACFLKIIYPNLTNVDIYTRDEKRFARLAELIKTKLNLSSNKSATIQQLFENNSVIIAATGHLKQVCYNPDWVQNGSLVLPIQVRSGWPADTLERFDYFVTDDIRQFKSSLCGENKPYPNIPDQSFELGKILANQTPLTLTPKDRIIAFNVGIGLNDLALANEYYIRALDKKLGTELILQNAMNDDINFEDLY